MRKIFLSVILIFFTGLSAFCSGNLELVNTQEIKLDNITDININYSSERVSLFMGTADSLIIKEYMSENNSEFFANISNTGNKVIVEKGRSPFRPIFNFFNRRLEVYLPLSYKNAISIKTSSGKIETSDLICSNIVIESSSGGISVDSIISDYVKIKSSSGSIIINNIKGEISVESLSGRINIDQAAGNLSAKASSGAIQGESVQGNAILNTNSGSIIFGTINGNVSAEASSGRIELNFVSGSVNAKTSSGSIRCTIGGNAGDVSLNTASGAVRLNLPQDSNYNFTSRTSSGRLTTPFSDKLFIPANDRNSTQGTITGNSVSDNIRTINIRTSSGSISVNWV